MANQDQSKDPFLAGVLSFVIPGAGQMYCDEIGKGAIILVGTIIGYNLLVVPGLAAHIWAIFDANKLAKSSNQKQESQNKEKSKHEMTSSMFASKVRKLHKLYENEMFNEEEYLEKKNALISKLYQKEVPEAPDDFLSSMITLKNDEILNQEEIKKIKLILY